MVANQVGFKGRAALREVAKVYGMPAAIVDAGLSDQVLPLSELAPGLAQEVAGWTS